MRVGVGHWELTLLWRYSALEIKGKRHQSPAAHAVWSGGPHLVGLGEHLVLCWNQAGPLQGAGDHCSCDPPAGRLLPHSHTEPLMFPHPSSRAHPLRCPCIRDLQRVPWLSPHWGSLSDLQPSLCFPSSFLSAKWRHQKHPKVRN